MSEFSHSVKVSNIEQQFTPTSYLFNICWAAGKFHLFLTSILQDLTVLITVCKRWVRLVIRQHQSTGQAAYAYLWRLGVPCVFFTGDSKQ